MGQIFVAFSEYPNFKVSTTIQSVRFAIHCAASGTNSLFSLVYGSIGLQLAKSLTQISFLPSSIIIGRQLRVETWVAEC